MAKSEKTLFEEFVYGPRLTYIEWSAKELAHLNAWEAANDKVPMDEWMDEDGEITDRDMSCEFDRIYKEEYDKEYDEIINDWDGPVYFGKSRNWPEKLRKMGVR